MTIGMPWLHTHKQKQMAECASNEVGENVVRLHSSSSSTIDGTQRALSVIAEAAHVIREREDRAAAVEADSEALLSDTMAQLQAAEERIKLLETDCKAAETYIRTFEAKLEEIEIIMAEADARTRAAEERLAHAEAQAERFAMRAKEAEKALALIEEAVRSQLIPKRPVTPTNRVAAA
jgi:chromosome segregation ATPase